MGCGLDLFPSSSYLSHPCLLCVYCWTEKVSTIREKTAPLGHVFNIFMGQNSGAVECDTRWVSGSRRFEDTWYLFLTRQAVQVRGCGGKNLNNKKRVHVCLDIRYNYLHVFNGWLTTSSRLLASSIAHLPSVIPYTVSKKTPQLYCLQMIQV